ncbi:unnamed protein product [Zymoseptoria tritici ST99CH_3D1]|uniref:Uncharacterized protein n=1 Tax=Zymoseptoria tritici ST99CH_1E4 TaxID=1276532 RepID=A0A2H1GTV8_ZYMTR|nr:unnamed protein product [Zymoseptoria tritici ST99CH_1E4]SMR59879.1 unnamed protein product [Zymoseptoria tritici ST99CH_3D1]
MASNNTMLRDVHAEAEKRKRQNQRPQAGIIPAAAQPKPKFRIQWRKAADTTWTNNAEVYDMTLGELQRLLAREKGQGLLARVVTPFTTWDHRVWLDERTALKLSAVDGWVTGFIVVDRAEGEKGRGKVEVKK